MPKHWVIIPAAGVGKRMVNTIAKQYLPLKNKTVLEHAIAPFLQHRNIEKLVICLAAEDKQWQHLSLANNPKITVTIGGSTRAESVLSGLKSLELQAKADDWVIIHDGVRPCLQLKELVEFMEKVTGVGGLMAVPVRDTLKWSSNAAHISNTVDRDLLWCAQTPQMFKYGQLLKALQQVNLKTITDESQAIELLGEKPMIVMGRHDNIKITYPEDLELAEKILC